LKDNVEIKSVFENNGKIPDRHTCNGENVSPPIDISDVPDGTKSMVLIVDDPDAPAGTWVHWVLWNIPQDTTKIEEDSVPENAIEGVNDFRKIGYGGPCPPSGTHRYFFKLYALDIKLGLKKGASKKDAERAMEGHILSQAKLVGLYGKK
jgi:hypothetical protein